jgi:hypothetical protein
MSDRASRGQEAEIAAGAALDATAAARFRERREATLVENAQRRERRDSTLRDSALAGGLAGVIGASLAWRVLKRRTQFTNTFLGISVSGDAIGGGGQAFVVQRALPTRAHVRWLLSCTELSGRCSLGSSCLSLSSRT